MFLHFGHLPFLPAWISGTLIFWPQFSQQNLIMESAASSINCTWPEYQMLTVFIK
jgi:hypothetical protein